MNWMERVFKLSEHGTNVRTELVAGLTTFLTMAYIIFVNPSILGMRGCQRGRLRGHLPYRGAGHDHHGAVRQLSHRAGAGHGPERLFRLRGGAAHGLHLAGRAGRGLRLGLPVPAGDAVRPAGADHQGHTAVHTHSDHRGHRPVPGADRAQERGHRRRIAGHLRDPGRPAQARSHPGLAGLSDHRGAGPPEGAGRHPDRHRRGHRGLVLLRGQRVPRRVFGAALHCTHLPAAGHQVRADRRHPQRGAGVLPGRAVRCHGHADGCGQARGPAGAQPHGPLQPLAAGRQRRHLRGLAAGHLQHHGLRGKRGRCASGWPHGPDGADRGRALPVLPVPVAPGRRGARLRHGARAVLRGLPDAQGADRDRMGRDHRGHPAAVTALLMPFTYSVANGLAFGFITYAVLKLFTGRSRKCTGWCG